MIELLGSEPARQFTLAEICRSLNISRATGHAILTTLTAHDWVTRDPASAEYAWGPAMASLTKPANSLVYRAELQALATDSRHAGIPHPPGGSDHGHRGDRR